MAPRTSRTRTAPQHRPLVSPSLTSVFSSFTQSSNGSSGSGSTITQESITKTRHRGPRRSERRSSGHVRRSRRVDPVTVDGKPNVFAFLEEEEEEQDNVSTGAQASIELPQSPRRQDIPPTAPMSPTAMASSFPIENVHHVSAIRASSIASLHSDSGISVRGLSPDRSSTTSSIKKTSSKGSSAKSAALARTKSMSSNSSVSSRTSYSEHEPESFYVKSGPLPPSKISSSRQLQLRPKTDRYGYDLLASQLSTSEEDCAKPIYRRFETLNNRCLLILQEEITGMEHEIADMDRNIALSEGGRSPSSQRADLQASQARWQRATFCAQIAPKLLQYNRALVAYQNAANMTGTSEEQVLQYKDLLDQHNPVVDSEMAFLDDIADLVTIKAEASPAPEQQKISYELGVALFFLILAFRLIPSLIGRIILGGSSVAFLAWSGRLPLDEDGFAGVLGRRAGIYAAAVFILSLAVG